MGILDWVIIALVFGGLAFIGVKTKQYVRGVAGFLAADRCAGRYLLTLADGIAGLGAIGIIATFQQNYEAGFGASWWGNMMGPVLMFVSISGFIIYRFRETRAMTIAEFYEIRYSRRFRVFAGVLAFFAGVVNYGIFPAVTARFIIYFCGLPVHIIELGFINFNVTMGIVMAVMLGLALMITFRGGQIAIMVTDFLQAQYVNIIFLVMLGILFMKFGWSDIIDTLKAAPEGKSMLNPFNQGEVPDFDMWYFLIGAFNVVYTYMAWQGTQGYNCSARSPHEAKMARVLGQWRFGVTWMVISLIPICAYVLMHNPEFSSEAQQVTSTLNELQEPGIEKQLTVPLALKQALPTGILGLFVAAMFAAAISTDDTYLHSWGSIFIQDVVMPFRKKPLPPEQHLRWLRRSILGVAIFVWCWSMVFPLQEYIFMYWAITGTIYVGGAGSVIIGGFYWARGTAAGAWAGMIAGSILGVLGTFINNIFWPFILPKIKTSYSHVGWIQSLPDVFWLNGMQMFFWSCLLAVTLYVVFSLLTKPKEGFSMDKMLHRGKYSLEGEHSVVDEKKKNIISRIVGVDKEYTGFDKFIAWSVFGWTAFWFTAFMIGNVLGFSGRTTESGWAKWWMFNLLITGIVGIITVFWFLIAGFIDLKKMFRTLKESAVDVSDDGMVDDMAAIETESLKGREVSNEER